MVFQGTIRLRCCLNIKKNYFHHTMGKFYVYKYSFWFDECKGYLPTCHGYCFCRRNRKICVLQRKVVMLYASGTFPSKISSTWYLCILVTSLKYQSCRQRLSSLKPYGHVTRASIDKFKVLLITLEQEGTNNNRGYKTHNTKGQKV